MVKIDIVSLIFNDYAYLLLFFGIDFLLLKEKKA